MANVDNTVQHAEGDSDYTICTVACRSAQAKPTGVIAVDKDIFQLLIQHADMSDYYENMYMIASRQTCLEWMRHHFKAIWHLVQGINKPKSSENRTQARNFFMLFFVRVPQNG